MDNKIKNYIEYRITRLFNECETVSKEILIEKLLNNKIIKSNKEINNKLKFKTEKDLINLNIKILNSQFERDYKTKQLKTYVKLENLKNKNKYTEKNIIDVISKIYNINNIKYAKKIAEIEKFI